MLGNSDFTDDDLYRSFRFFSAYSQDLIALLIIRILEVKDIIFRNYGSSPVLKKIGFLTGLDLLLFSWICAPDGVENTMIA